MILIPVLNPDEDTARPGNAKAIVMAEVTRIVEEGHAAIAILESGTLELRLVTGEIFHLNEETVTRTV
jgi:hypothetical protein